MGKLPAAAELEIVPAWLQFIGEALPARQVTRAVAAGGRTVSNGNYLANMHEAKYLNKIVSGEIKWPGPDTIWDCAEKARSLDESAWCAGPLAIFAASHFEVFAKLLVLVPNAFVNASRKRMLIDAVVGACAPSTATEDFAAVKESLIANGADQLELVRHERKFRRTRQCVASPERSAWVLTKREESGFDHAWSRRAQPIENAAVAAAQLVGQHHKIRLCLQRQIVCTMLREELVRNAEGS